MTKNQLRHVYNVRGCEISEHSLNDVSIKKIGSNLLDIVKDFTVRFRTIDMDQNRYVFQRDTSNFPSEVAVMAEFMPTFTTFDNDESKDKSISYTEDEWDFEDMETPVDEELDFEHFFVFIVDRSGSMGGERIEITKKALELFMQSLPPKSTFQIISFGSNFDQLKLKNTNGRIEYNDKNKDAAIRVIEDFVANYGGTNIYSPL